MTELFFNGPAGRMEARYHAAERPDAPVALILHPNPQLGGTMNNKVVYTLYQAFAKLGFSVLRFNFRGVGKSQGVFDGDSNNELADTLAAEITPYEKNFVCKVEKEEGKSAAAIPAEDARAYVTAMYLAPNGVQSRNMHMDGFVVTSVNMGVVRAEEERLVIIFSPRSSVASLQEEMKARLGLLAETFGFACS